MGKVQFGISNVYLFERSESSGTVTYSNPLHLAGAVSIDMEPQSEQNVFYADNVKYWTGDSMQGYEADLEVALVPDAIKTAFLGYMAASNGNLIETNTQGKAFGLVYQFETDDEARRVVMYNCTMGRPTEEHNTREDSTDPEKQTLKISVNGEAIDGIQCFKAEVKPTDSNYETVFSSIALPVFSN